MFVLPPEGKPKYDVFCFFDKVFSPKECEDIITLGNSLPEYEGSVSQGEIDVTLRKNRISWISWNPQETDWIFQKIHEVVTGANNARYGFDLVGFIEPLQFTKYQGQADHYDWHSDHGAGKFSIRKISAVFQLSPADSYTGCDLEFANDPGRPNQQKIREQGTGIVFPSFERHRVTPLLSGSRHSLVVWASGPPFR